MMVVGGDRCGCWCVAVGLRWSRGKTKGVRGCEDGAEGCGWRRKVVLPVMELLSCGNTR